MKEHNKKIIAGVGISLIAATIGAFSVDQPVVNPYVKIEPKWCETGEILTVDRELVCFTTEDYKALKANLLGRINKGEGLDYNEVIIFRAIAGKEEALLLEKNKLQEKDYLFKDSGITKDNLKEKYFNKIFNQ